MKAHALDDSLLNLGIPFEEHRVLLALPLVYVAWADDAIEPAQTSAIERIAREEFSIDPRSRHILHGWFRERPSTGYFQEGFRLLRSLSSHSNELSLSGEDLQRSLLLAGSIARLGADSRGEPDAVSRNQADALHVVAALLEVDAGTTWAKMLTALEGGRAGVEPEPHETAQNESDTPGEPSRGDDDPTGDPMRRRRTRARLNGDGNGFEPGGGLV